MQIREIGEELVALIGETDKPEVEKNLDDLETTWKSAQSQWAERQRHLDDALRKATRFQNELICMLEWLQKKQEQLSALGPIGQLKTFLKRIRVESWVELERTV